MKNTKWIWRVLAVLLTLIILAGVGFAGFRLGSMHNFSLANGTSFMPSHGHGFNGAEMGQMRGFDHGRGGFSFFSPIFGVLRLAVWAGLIWLVFTLVKRSGWRVVNVNANQTAVPAPAPGVVQESPSAEDDVKKDEA